MAKQKESRLQRNIRGALEAEFIGSYWWKIHGGNYQPAGLPDLLGCVDGLYVALEVKRPGEEESLIQRRMIERLRSAGAIVAVVMSAAEAIDAVRGVGAFKVYARTGQKSEVLYATWQLMLRRCYVEEHDAYHRYGGRGIRVYYPWTIRHYGHGFWRFKEYLSEQLGPRPEGYQLDRIHNDQNYAPGNLRWSTPAANTQNSSSAKLTASQVEKIRARYAAEGSGRRGVKGRVTAKQLGKEFGVSRRTINKIVSGDRW